MTRRAVAAFVSAGMLAAAASGAAQQTPTFRARTDLVSVNVSVKNRNVPVTGLTGKDFVLFDNGVRQAVEEVSIEGVPIDLTLFLDTSTSFFGHAETLTRNMQEIVGLLRADDRMRLLVLGKEIEEVMPWTKPARLPNLEPYRATRISPAYDGIAAALLHQPEPGRRHLVIAMTDGADFNGVVSSQRVLDISGHVEGVLHLMLMPPAVRRVPAAPHQPMLRAPDVLGDGRLESAAERTGGRVHSAAFVGVDVVGRFKEIFDDFRTSYVLRYAPTGVKPEGWHDVKVEVPSAPKATIRARRGYVG
jgi:hypothetical protein